MANLEVAASVAKCTQCAPRAFAQAFEASDLPIGKPGVIAEVKAKASPSKGILREPHHTSRLLQGPL